jgi:hypothetical protein
MLAPTEEPAFQPTGFPPAGFQPTYQPETEFDPKAQQAQPQPTDFHAPLIVGTDSASHIDESKHSEGDVNTWKNKAHDPYLLLLFLTGAAALCMIQALSDCEKWNTCKDRYGYAVATGVVSLFFTMVYLLVDKLNKMPAGVLRWLSLLLLAWWICAVLVLTGGNGPFHDTGNGYFATWVGFICAALLAHTCHERVRSVVARVRNSGPDVNLALGVCSAVVIWQAGILCADKPCQRYTVWAIIWGAVSLAFSLIFIFFPIQNILVNKIIALFFMGWWVAGAGIFTFYGPFMITGNGYFGSWGACMASIILAQHFWVHVLPK